MTSTYDGRGFYLYRGETYRGTVAVAEAAGVHRNTVSEHLTRYGHLDNLTHNRDWKTTKKPLIVKGHEFPSLRAFARLTGTHPSCVTRHVQNGNTAWLEKKLDEALS